MMNNNSSNKIAMENAIESHLSKFIQDQIDWDIMSRLKIENGWTKITLQSGFHNKEHSVDLLMWAVKNCHSYFNHYGKEWLFESKQDATMFALRWS